MNEHVAVATYDRSGHVGSFKKGRPLMTLPKLRLDLDVMPSPDPSHPGLFIRDNYRYSDAWIIVPPVLVPGLKYFDGVKTEPELEAEISRVTGDANAAAIVRQLVEGLDKSGFLDNETFAHLRATRHQAFADSPVRLALHAGSGYPGDATELTKTLTTYLTDAPAPRQPRAVGIAAPHVSPGGGWHSYGRAYNTLTPDLSDRTFVILGTSHFGPANRFGLTRKAFQTPFGLTGTNPALLDELALQPAVVMEDYCQSIEHSIEFQVIFLQHLYGPNVKILPLLCGSFGPSVYHGGMPEDDDVVHRFFSTLAEIAARDADKLFFVMGVDMAHIGVRYGDRLVARAEENEMLQIRERDFRRMASLNSGNIDAFWDDVKFNRDDLRWCGSSPMYTFMKILPEARGSLQHYEQWNIDEQSVVSFAGISFSRG